MKISSNDKIYFRSGNVIYASLVKRISPDILIEDDYESIGRSKEIIYPRI